MKNFIIMENWKNLIEKREKSNREGKPKAKTKTKKKIERNQSDGKKCSLFMSLLTFFGRLFLSTALCRMV